MVYQASPSARASCLNSAHPRCASRALEGLGEVASVDTWAFLEDAHRVGILQDLYTERVLPGANQLHGLQNHYHLPQA